MGKDKLPTKEALLEQIDNKLTLLIKLHAASLFNKQSQKDIVKALHEMGIRNRDIVLATGIPERTVSARIAESRKTKNKTKGS